MMRKSFLVAVVCCFSVFGVSLTEATHEVATPTLSFCGLGWSELEALLESNAEVVLEEYDSKKGARVVVSLAIVEGKIFGTGITSAEMSDPAPDHPDMSTQDIGLARAKNAAFLALMYKIRASCSGCR